MFSPLCYSTADLLVDGEYVNGRQFIYTMTEVRDDGDGITYASDIYRITVTVWDNGDGTLTVTAEPNGEENEFVNTYEAFGSCAFRTACTTQRVSWPSPVQVDMVKIRS